MGNEERVKDIESLWELYGLQTNPFATTPLLVQGGLMPIESFHGRDVEQKRIMKIFSSSGGSRLLVCGDVGVGKTSLVNYSRYQAIQKGYFTPFKEIAVQAEWNADRFIINTLYGIFSTLKLKQTEILDKPTLDKLQNLVELTAIETKITAGNVSVLGSGIGGEVTETRRVSSTMSSLALADFAQEIIQKIREKTGKDVIIHYNNLERQPEKNLRELFEDLRDFFQTPNVHFVFVGNLTVHSTFQTMPRFSSIISDTPIMLSELSLPEIEEILKGRIEKLRISPDLNVVTPFRREVLKLLFDLYGGNIRNILNSLSTAVIELTNERSVVLDVENLSKTLSAVVQKRYLSGLQPRAVDVLFEAVKHPEITNKYLSKNSGIARSNISTYTQELEKHGCLYVRRRDGKDKYWSVEPKIKWLLLEKKMPAKIKHKYAEHVKNKNQQQVSNYE